MRVDAARHLRLPGVLLLTLVAVLHGPPTAAQGGAAAAPETRDMIEALKPSRNRNLLVRQTSSGAAPAASSVAAATTVSTTVSTTANTAVSPAANTAANTAANATANTAPTAAATAAVSVTPSPSPVPPRPVAATPAAGPAAGEAPPSLSLAIQFELNSARVRPESGPVLGNLVAAMTSSDLKGHRFVIEGHTDARGNPATNRQLSQQRADEVRLYLVALGVHPSRLRAVGKGSTDLANARDPLSADNRRVRVVTLE